MYYIVSKELYHHGILGQRWGVRRWQNADGSYTAAGERHYGIGRRIRNTLGTISKHYSRNLNNVDIPRNKTAAKKAGWKKLSDSMSAMHQFDVKGVWNEKWLSPDGKREAVFSKSDKGRTKLETNPKNIATYNIFDPTTFKGKVGHALADVLPYYAFGNGADDDTSLSQRVITSGKQFIESVKHKKVKDL